LAAYYIYGLILLMVISRYIVTGYKFSLFNIYFGLFFAYYGPAFFIYNISNRILYKEYAIDTTYMLSLFVIFYFAGRQLFVEVKGRRKVAAVNYNKWLTMEVQEEGQIKKSLLFWLILINTIVLLLGLFFYGGISSLFTLISNPLADADLIKQLRQDAGVTGWIAPLYVYINSGLGRLLSFVFIGLAFYGKNKLMIVLSFAFALLLSISYLANLSKSSFVVFYMQLIFFLMLYFNVKINFRKTIIFMCLVIPLLLGIYLIATNASSAGEALGLISNRIFNEPIRVLELYPKYYPHIRPHTYGANIRLLHDLIAYDEYVPAFVVVTGGLEHASFNAMFIADAYVDFSFWGVAFQSLFVGYLLAWLDFIVFSKNNLLQKSLLASLLIGIFSLINIGLITSLIGFGLGTLPIITRWLRKKKKRKHIFIPQEQELNSLMS